MSYTSFDQNDELAINTIRVLAAETVAKANSGHPGMSDESYWPPSSVWLASMVLTLTAF